MPFELITVSQELTAVSIADQVITQILMLEPGDHTFRIDHVRSVLTPGHEPDGGIGRTTTTGAEYVLRAGRFGSAQSVEARSQAHERFRLSIGIAVEGVAGNLVVKALQLAHVLGHAQKALDTFASKEFREFLDSTGLGNHPEMVRAFAKVGKLMSEDSFVTGQGNGSPKNDLVEAFYPSKK